MATYRYIDDFNIKDTYKFIRNIPSTPNDETIAEAWWTVKTDITTPDDESMYSLHITPVLTSSGLVNNYADLTARLLFTAQPIDSALMDPLITYYYDIQIKLANDEIYTIESGRLFTGRTVTHGS
jgi:hypothetical protein